MKPLAHYTMNMSLPGTHLEQLGQAEKIAPMVNA
jgi:hypothetical protein